MDSILVCIPIGSTKNQRVVKVRGEGLNVVLIMEWATFGLRGGKKEREQQAGVE